MSHLQPNKSQKRSRGESLPVCPWPPTTTEDAPTCPPHLPQTGTGFEAVFEAYDAELRRTQAAAAAVESTNASLAQELASVQLELGAAKAAAMRSAGGSPARRSGPHAGCAACGADDAEDDAAVEMAVAEAAAGVDAGRGVSSPRRLGLERGGSPNRGRSSSSADAKGVHVLRVNMKRLQERAAALEAELVASKRKCLSLLRFQRGFEMAAAKLQQTDATTNAAQQAAAVARARAAEAAERADTAEARVVALEAEKEDLLAVRVGLVHRLEELGEQLAELKRGTRRQQLLAGTAADQVFGGSGGMSGGKGVPHPTGGASAQHAQHVQQQVKQHGQGDQESAGAQQRANTALVAFNGALGDLMSEIQRGLQQREQVDVQRELLLDMVARPYPQRR